MTQLSDPLCSTNLGNAIDITGEFFESEDRFKKLSSCILFFCFIVVKILSLQFLWHLRFVEFAWISHVMTLSSSSLKSWGKAHTQVFLRVPTSLKTWSSESNQWGHAVAWELAHLSDFYIKKGKGVKNVIGKSFSANWQLWSSNSYGWELNIKRIAKLPSFPLDKMALFQWHKITSTCLIHSPLPDGLFSNRVYPVRLSNILAERELGNQKDRGSREESSLGPEAILLVLRVRTWEEINSLRVCISSVSARLVWWSWVWKIGMEMDILGLLMRMGEEGGRWWTVLSVRMRHPDM